MKQRKVKIFIIVCLSNEYNSPIYKLVKLKLQNGLTELVNQERTLTDKLTVTNSKQKNYLKQNKEYKINNDFLIPLLKMECRYCTQTSWRYVKTTQEMIRVW